MPRRRRPINTRRPERDSTRPRVSTSTGAGTSSDSQRVRVIPIGGLGEVGMNMMIVETDSDIVVIDAGLMFPDAGMPGVERIVPNMDYLASKRSKVRALLVTHGHLDHIGAIPNLLEVVDVPVYAPRLALDMVTATLRRQGRRRPEMRIISPGRPYEIGTLTAEWVPMCHSIPDSCSIYLTTPAGGIFHTGDFKLDDSPTLGDSTDYRALARVADRGVRLLLSDSTNAMVSGRSGSDSVASAALHEAIASAPGRVIVASFSTQLARLQMVADAAAASGRHLSIIGRGLRDTSELARKAGHLNIPANLEVPPSDLDVIPDDKIVIMTTGTQGEPASGLVRMSRGNHRDVKLQPDDTIILSSRTIPGNEDAVNTVLNDLAKHGVRVITARDRRVHVSGHAAADELKLVVNMLRPDYFTPIHGEYRMLRAHCELAADVGLPPERINLITDGDVLELGPNGARLADPVSAGGMLVHGADEWGDEGTVVRERRRLARDGVVFVSLAIDEDGILMPPQLATTGFVDAADADALLDDAAKMLIESVDSEDLESLGLEETQQDVKASLERFFSNRTRRRPLIMVTCFDLRAGQIRD